MKRSKPFMGSGPEVEEPESAGSSLSPFVENYITEQAKIHQLPDRPNETEQLRSALNAVVSDYNELKEKHEQVLNKLQQVNMAFAAHLSECQGQDEEEPREKRCL